jgi:hypothetical protein
MATIHLSQGEADFLIGLEKHRVDDKQYLFAQTRLDYRIPLISADGRETFTLDLSRGSINMQKMKFQNRARKAIILLRLDLDSNPHRNPDGERIVGPHIHIYREGYGDRWAYLLTSPQFQSFFQNIGDEWQTFQDFLRLANVTRPPVFERGLL